MARFKITGDKKVMAKLLRQSKNHEVFDNRARLAIQNIQAGAGRRTPVDTGFLQSQLTSSDNRQRANGSKSGAWEMIDGTEYTIVQEYEHATKSAFIRDSIIDEEPEFHRDLEKIAKKGNW